MSLNDYLKCPGPDRSVSAFPEEIECPACHAFIEIWTDEKKRKCHECGSMIFKIQTIEIPSKKISEPQINELIKTAIFLGASDAKNIPSSEILVENHLASLCNGEPKCENYGLSASCPPHVSGPSEFSEWQKKSTTSIVVKIDLPSNIMFSGDRREIMKLLHEIVAGVEQKAVNFGFKSSKAFAGGSCKKIFCPDKKACRHIFEQGECRYPDSARPSMSGFGINVSKMMQSVGWPAKMIRDEKLSDREFITWVAGLILICDV